MIILSIFFICSSFFTGCENFNNSNNSNNNGNSNDQEINPYDVFTSDVLYYGTARGELDFLKYENIEVDGKRLQYVPKFSLVQESRKLWKC